jgi:pseudouridine synthase
MFAGDWPVCTLKASFAQWVGALKQIVKDRPIAFQKKLFHDNAAKFYERELSYRLTHPKFEHEKEYRVLVEGIPNGEDLQRWRDGVLLHGETEKTAKAEVSLFGPRAREGADASNTWLRVILHEGRKRQIKRVAKHIGHPVIELQRVRMGRLKLGDLPIGQWRHLTEKEVGELKGS